MYDRCTCCSITFFFFKQKTAYDMRISDWSSDVCSSDLQLDGSIAPFDALAAIVDAVGDRVEVICDGGITRGTHLLKALSVGAKACSGGRLYLYALAAAGEDGVARAIALLRAEMERGMKRSEEHTSELQSLMRISYAVFCL